MSQMYFCNFLDVCDVHCAAQSTSEYCALSSGQPPTPVGVVLLSSSSSSSNSSSQPPPTPACNH